jgi:hypothetical protein
MKRTTLHLLTASLLALGCASAFAEPVAVVSSKSAIGAASKDDVGNLFLGKANALGGAAAVAVALKEGNATRDAFYTKFAGKSSDQAKAVISKQVFTGKAQPLKEVASDADIKSALAGDPTAVGMIDSASVDGTVKVISK